ncbi:MAG: DNA mismatch repair endonuclease MutL [Acidobacteriota bacterium]|nr:DNA mismatch repair endonuclease MutL [Acidobacteriota bacterium]
MGRIRVLDDGMVNRIAAGEVVERPASVVKELVENSLDAESASIEIQVASGGKRMIRVVDDGVGMDRDDALLALERHATSKLRRTSDLQAIETLGFRGEALPSIAAVSRLLLRTAPSPGVGTEVEVRGGRIGAVREIGTTRGTTIEVASLFFNVPARKKFLRSESTELSHIVRFVTRFALAHPPVRFRLEHGGRRLIDVAGAGDVNERIRQLLGSDLAGRLIPFREDRGSISVHGFAGRPVDASARRDAQHIFVNGRFVQDRVLLHAVREAYGNTMPRDRHPALFLFVEIDPSLVDVNVHPQKTEVRFGRPGEIHDAVHAALATALGDDTAIPSYGELRPTAVSSSPVASAALRYLELREGSTARTETGAAGAVSSRRETATPRLPIDRVEGSGGRPGLDPLVQFLDSYIVAQQGEDLVLVDQHAAHERVLFERYLHAAEIDRVETQKLLFPVTVELTPSDRVVLGEEAAEFRRLGFELEPFGETTVRIDAVPAVAANLEPGRLLTDLLGEAAGLRTAASGVPELRRKLITTAACHAAIKVHHALTREEMRQLLADLSMVENPTTCPHGRPALFRLTLEEVERAFRRR